MKKSKNKRKGRTAAKRVRGLRAYVLACVLLVVGAATAIAKYEQGSVAPARAKQTVAASQAGNDFVTVEVGGKKLRVNAQALQQGPLTQAQSEQLAGALKDNKKTDGLVEVEHANGAVEVDLQGRFQNVTLAKKNDDGTLSEACVDNPEAAAEFLKGGPTSTGASGGGATRKAVSIQ